MNKDKNKINEIVKYLFETGQLKRVKRSGWWLIGIDNPENVAEHSFRSAIIGYFIGKLEGLDAEKVAMMALFNDMHESRVNDLHKVGQRYVDFKKAEKIAFEEQVSKLPGEIRKEIIDNFNQLQNDLSKEGIAARDADLIENAVQAKEYIDIGYKEAQDWLNNIRKVIKTKTSKAMLDIIEKTDSNSWWKGLKKITR